MKCEFCGQELAQGKKCRNLDCVIKALRAGNRQSELFKDEEVTISVDFPEVRTIDAYLDYIFTVLVRYLGVYSVFKGGYILNKRIPRARATTDIDFSISNKTDAGHVYQVLKEIGEVFVTKGAAEDYTVQENISETSSGRLKITLQDGTQVGVDVGLHDLSYGVQEYQDAEMKYKVFSVERSLADKISVFMSYKRFRRIKDLYDIYVFSKHCDIDYELLRQCVEKRCSDIDWNMIPFTDNIVEQVVRAWSKLDLVRIAGPGKVHPDFSAVEALDRFYEIVGPLKQYDREIKRWKHESECWSV